MKTNKKLSIVCASAMVAMMTSCGGGSDAQQAAPQIPDIATMTVQYAESDLSYEFPATLEGVIDTDVRPQVSGNITQVLVREGDHVQKGQVMFKLDDVPYAQAVAQAQAALNAAKVVEATQLSTEQQKKHLFEQNIIGKYEYDLAVNALSQAKAQVAQCQAALTSAQNNLSYTSVKAPANGVVGQIPFREGYLASPSMMQPLTTVSDVSEIIANFALTENDLYKVTDNGTAGFPNVQLKMSNGNLYGLEGTVESVSGKIDPTTGAFRVRAAFANPDGVLRSGSTGQVLIPQKLKDVIIIPQKATYEVQDRRFAYVVGDSAKVVSAPITVSPLSDGKNFIVTSGLTPGQTIVIEGVGSKIREGMQINPVAAPAQESAQE